MCDSPAMYAGFASVSRLSCSFWPRTLFTRRRNHCCFRRANTIPPANSVTLIQSNVREVPSISELKWYSRVPSSMGPLIARTLKKWLMPWPALCGGVDPGAPTNCADELIAKENGFHPRDHAWFELEESIDSFSRVLTALSPPSAKGEI